MQFSSKTMLKLLAPAGLCLAVAGCTNIPGYTDYGDHSDKVSLQGGDAVAMNRHIQTEHPWPRNVNNTHIHTDGDQAAGAVSRYKTDKVKPPESLTTSDIGG